MVPDVMHDLLEGVGPYVMKEMLKVMIQKKYLTLRDLNDAIENFPYGSTEITSKPSIIPGNVLNSNDNQEGTCTCTCICNDVMLCVCRVHMLTRVYNFSYLAAQWWCLARLLPLMIGDKIPVDDCYWENYLTLLEILDYLMAPVISLDDIAYLGTIIEQHHIHFKALYPNCSITPKFHNLIHYTEFISRLEIKIMFNDNIHVHLYRCGPVRNFWSMRFESKHSYLLVV